MGPLESARGACEVLLVDDEATILASLRDSLREAGAQVVTASSGEQALGILEIRRFHVVVSDVRMPGLSGFDLLDRVRKDAPETEIVLMTAFATVQQAVEAMKMGAFDYVTKPFPNEKIVRMVANIWSMLCLRFEVADLRTRRAEDPELDYLVGNSKAWRDVLDRVRTIAPTDSTVLVLGPSGTGKELVSRALHQMSRRSSGPFIRVHCAALPESLIENELFGHDKGAYTGADRPAPGRFELAHEGTILLDEVDELPPVVQVKLLRVIQERTIERLGSGRSVEVDVRILATTKRDLRELVDEGRIREDLFYRLTVLQVRLPPLTERRDDIPLLAAHFMQHFSKRMLRTCKGFSREAMEVLLAYDFPGNVRELEHIVESACALSCGDVAGVEALPEVLLGGAPVRPSFQVGFHARPLAEVMESFERSYLEHCLREFKGSRGSLAEILRISRKGLWQKLKRFGLADGVKP